TVAESGLPGATGWTRVTRPSAGETMISEPAGIVLSGSRKKYNMNRVRTRKAAATIQIANAAKRIIRSAGTAMNGIPSLAIGKRHLEEKLKSRSLKKKIGGALQSTSPP